MRANVRRSVLVAAYECCISASAASHTPASRSVLRTRTAPHGKLRHKRAVVAAGHETTEVEFGDVVRDVERGSRSLHSLHHGYARHGWNRRGRRRWGQRRHERDWCRCRVRSRSYSSPPGHIKRPTHRRRRMGRAHQFGGWRGERVGGEQVSVARVIARSEAPLKSPKEKSRAREPGSLWSFACMDAALARINDRVDGSRQAAGCPASPQDPGPESPRS